MGHRYGVMPFSEKRLSVLFRLSLKAGIPAVGAHLRAR